jgi:hypothetical protein
VTFQADGESIVWRLHLASTPEAVYQMLDSDEGRARFWAESAVETAGVIAFTFPGNVLWQGRILRRLMPFIFQVEYYGGSITTFELASDGRGGTDLTLTDEGVPQAHRDEVVAGWVSVLMALKAAVDFGVDLRNHDGERTWEQGYADN